ncbi:6957e9de-1e4a-4b07-9806-5e13a73ab912-CDS [Sclerotinia trifoliorum]|uniref:6957e9de-1e4a-4b07-9806-5e13a73ab912-CDS n=1 Tax=Sclerotinia trifoliorum TaxID=28548 RepID=A0A8H2VUB2_9HELO|nr:6957e9de-1e4a-4b07-9806-5e13a73ab912-CDS [Sclerotinia trifoliorum]
MAGTQMDHNYTIMPTSDHTHTVIFLHGRDSKAEEFASEFFESQASDGRTFPEILPGFKWVFPSSKMRLSARFETEMSQWFDIWCVQEPQQRKELQINGLIESIEQVVNVIDNEADHIPKERIFLAGISQGCVTAILTLLLNPMRLAGFIGLSSWLPFEEETMSLAASLKMGDEEGMRSFKVIQMKLSPDATLNRETTPILTTPVFLSHSKDDDVVPESNGDVLYRGLRELGMKVTRKIYEDGGHWINEPQGVDDIVAFIQTLL